MADTTFDPNSASIVNGLPVEYVPVSDYAAERALARKVYFAKVSLDRQQQEYKDVCEKLMTEAGTGVTFEINDRGGQVQITAGGQERYDDSLKPVFNIDAYYVLDEKTRAMLEKKGVVKMERKLIRATAPQVRVTVK